MDITKQITNRINILTFLLLIIPQTVGNVTFFDLTELNIKESYKKIYKQFVTLTIYSPSPSQTDSTPNLTASGFKIDTSNPSKHKIIAVSRDLKKKGWDFGKKVRIKKAGKFDGVYTIRDLMNKRHKNRIDVLVGDEHKPVRLRNVEVTLIN